MRAEWPTVGSEAALYLQRRVWTVLAWGLLMTAGSQVLSNPYAIALYRMDPSDLSHYRFQLSLVATCFYLVPPLAVLLIYDWRDRLSALLAVLGPDLPGYARAELTRVVVMSRCLVLIAVAGAGFVLATVAGSHLLWQSGARLVGVVLVYPVAVVYGLTFVLAGAAAGARRACPARVMQAMMIALSLIYVGVPIVSDILLYLEFGPMPAPGSGEWFAYLDRIADSTGIRVYLLSPAEVFLVLCTGAFAVGHSEPLWQALAILSIQLGVCWLLFTIRSGRLRSASR